jgi:hypothetical protein
MPLTAFGHSDMIERMASRLEMTTSRLDKLKSLQSLTFEDTCLTLKSVAQLSRLQNLKHLRVSWAYEETAEADLLAGRPNHESPSTVTRLELLTPRAPKDVSVNYILQFYPSLKELSCKYKCLGAKGLLGVDAYLCLLPILSKDAVLSRSV